MEEREGRRRGEHEINRTVKRGEGGEGWRGGGGGGHLRFSSCVNCDTIKLGFFLLDLCLEISICDASNQVTGGPRSHHVTGIPEPLVKSRVPQLEITPNL